MQCLQSSFLVGSNILLIWYCNVLMTMIGAHKQAVLKKATKHDLIQLILGTEATLDSQIPYLSKKVKDTLTHFKKLETDIAAVKTVNNRFVERLFKIKRQRWEEMQYSQQDTLEIVGISNSLDNSALKEMLSCFKKRVVLKLTDGIFKLLIPSKTRQRTFAKCVNRKDRLQILTVKKKLKSLDPTELDFPENTKFFVK